MDRREALVLLKEHLHSPNLLSHSLAVASIMKALAARLAGDEDEWELAGLLHDIDYDETEANMELHALVGGRLLQEKGLPQTVVNAVISHNEIHGVPRDTVMNKALWAADPVSGFITAAALIRPDKSIAEVQLKSLKKRFKENSFARGANREQMASCSEFGLELDEFLSISLAAMQGIAAELGLQGMKE
ncbi:MAG: HDIG domain-containing metalloprotein [Deltaproteobacteria bacterium]